MSQEIAEHGVKPSTDGLRYDIMFIRIALEKAEDLLDVTSEVDPRVALDVGMARRMAEHLLGQHGREDYLSAACPACQRERGYA